MSDEENKLVLKNAALGNALALPELVDLAEQTKETIAQAVPTNTRRAYEGDIQRFFAWADDKSLGEHTDAAETVALYLQHLANEGLSMATITRALAAIIWEHGRRQPPVPSLWKHELIKRTRKGLERQLGVRSVPKQAAVDDILRQILDAIPETWLGIRDKALLSLGWAGAFRRSELVALNVSDIESDPEGLRVLIRRGKTDQRGEGRWKPIHFSSQERYCPVRLLEKWRIHAAITTGALFRTEKGERIAPKTVASRVKRWAREVGLDATKFGGHSLRSGFVTTAVQHGKTLDAIQVVTGHTDIRTLLKYIQFGTLHERGAGKGLL